MITAFTGKYRLVWLVSAALVPACGGDESNAGGSSDETQCVDPNAAPNTPECFGMMGWGSGAGGGFGAGSGGSTGVGMGGSGVVPPPGCGNGTIGAGEQCDGAQLNGATCATATMGALPVGNVSCSADCRIVATGCSSLGGGGTGGIGTGGGSGTGARPGSGGSF